MKHGKLKCESCGEDPHMPVDVCERCGKDFGESGDDGNGAHNSRCVHCRHQIYSQHCGKCRERLPEAQWV